MVENLIELGILFTLITIVGKVIVYRAILQTKNTLYKKTNIKPTADHLALVYSQEEQYDSIYYEVQYLFKNLMQKGVLSREQILFIKNYLRQELKDYRHLYTGHYKNDAQEIYTLLKSPLLNNSNYEYIVNVLKDFTIK